jgi:hypothetical protein
MSETFFTGNAEPPAARIAGNTIEWWTAGGRRNRHGLF